MRDRVRDYAVLLTIAALLTLPCLGAPSFWDMDEGVNAETAREMRQAETWIIPTYNYQLRTAKPVMLYWLQRVSYSAFGASEWSARLPSVLAGWCSVLMVYELARRMFGRSTGLLAGLMLASVAQFAMLAHAATPDATLLAFTILAYLLFWVGHLDGSRTWWITMSIANGLAFLTKGPVGLVLPILALFSYFAWNRELRRLLDYRCILAGFVFTLVAGPWYGLVAGETRGEWVKVFFERENLERFKVSMDKHSGTVAYYLAILPFMFAPWCAFLLPLFWYGVAGSRRARNTLIVTEQVGSVETTAAKQPIGQLTDPVRAHRLLLCWIMAYVVVFSAAATKLPNYIFPIMPAMVILAARFLILWRDGLISVPRWLMAAIIGAVALVGAGCCGGLVLANQFFPGLRVWSVLGVIPLAGAIGMTLYLRKDNRNGFIATVTATSVIFIGLIVVFPPREIEPWKAPRELVRMSGVDDSRKDIRLGYFEGLLPSLVYYSGREVKELLTVEKAAEFLEIPTPGYLIVLESTWKDRVKPKVRVQCKIVARRFDFLEKGTLVVVTNDMLAEVANCAK